MFLAAVVIGIMAIGFLVAAREEALDGDHRRAWHRAGIGGPLMIVAIGVCWLGIVRPDWADVRHDDGFGPGWFCEPLGKGGNVCEHDPFTHAPLGQTQH